MLERLMNMERPYGEPGYSGISKQISEIRQSLGGRLEPAARALLEELSDAHIRRENVLLKDVFADGFWSAIELMLEYQRRKPL